MKALLVIEDDDAIRESLIEILGEEGYVVLSAENGKRGIETLHSAGTSLPAMILLDLTMPVMNGMEFLDEVKSQPQWKDIPVVVFTAAGGREKPPLAQGFLRKPLQLE